MEGGKPPRDCKQSLRPYKSLISLHSALFFSSNENHSHNHRLSRWLAQPYKGMLLAGLKTHRKI